MAPLAGCLSDSGDATVQGDTTEVVHGVGPAAECAGIGAATADARVCFTTPRDEAEAVVTDPLITVKFNVDVEPGSLTLELDTGGDGPDAGAVEYDPDRRMAQWSPAEELPGGEVTATVAFEHDDQSREYQWSFTTSAGDAVGVFAIGGTVGGLQGDGLELTLNAGEQGATLYAGDDEFTFPELVEDGTDYEVAVAEQPAAAFEQECSVLDGTGTVSGGEVTVSVTCNYDPWASGLHHGALHVGTNATRITTEWPDNGADYTLYLTTDPDTDLRNPGAYGAESVTAATSGYVFENLEAGEYVYIALEADGVLQSWTAARPNAVTFDRQVDAVAVDTETGTQYVGGDFSRVATTTGSGVTLPPADTGVRGHALASPEVVGNIQAAAPDGQGGWFIGGTFARVGGEPRDRLAQVDAQGRVTDWNPGADGPVNTLAVSEDVVYVGGEFNQVGDQDRENLAAIGTDGEVIAGWDPGADDLVYALAVSGDVVYTGGTFGSVGGADRNSLAAIGTEGDLLDWDADVGCDCVNPVVNALVVSDGVVYAGGWFDSIGESPRENLAAIDATGEATEWAPGSNGPVKALAASGGVVYAGGWFTQVDGEERGRLAAVDDDGSVTDWVADGADNAVNALAVSDGVVYVGGEFTEIDGHPRDRLAAIDIGGDLTDWDPGADELVNALEVSGDLVYAGGEFIGVGAQRRAHLAAIDNGGDLTDWDPGADDLVNALEVSDGVVYAGGWFESVGGEERKRLAAIDTDGDLTDWDPGANEIVHALAVSGDVVYAGGDFTEVGGQGRGHVAAIGTDGDLIGDWNPEVVYDGGTPHVGALAVSDGVVYVGGEFTDIDSEPRDHLAAIGTDGDLVGGWAPEVGGDALGSHRVAALAVSAGVVYVGGLFPQVGDEDRNGLAAIDAAAGTLTEWDPNLQDPVSVVEALAVSGDVVYAGGAFTSVGDEDRNSLAAIGTDGHLVTDWDAGLDGGEDISPSIRALAVSGDVVYAGGSFVSAGGQPRGNFAAIGAGDDLLE